MIAVIDCGTNTFHLLIVEKTADGAWRFVERTLHVAFRSGPPPGHGAGKP